MSTNDAFVERLRRAYRDAARERESSGGPSDDAIVDLVLGRLEGTERDRVADAVAADPELAALVRDLMRVHAASSLRLARPRASRRVWIPVAIAASLVVVAGLVAWRGGEAPEGPDAIRGAAPAAPGFEPADGAVLAAPPKRLAWAVVPGATSYRVTLFDAESKAIWRGPDTPTPSLSLPDIVLRGFAPGRTYYWRVDYRLGVERRRLPLAEFRLRP